MLESDLYEPIKNYLELQGYTVQGEVKNCDVTAIQGDDLIIIELKKNFNLGLLLQATDRQRMTDSVYVAIPKKALPHNSERKGKLHLLKRLELGLILVDFDPYPPAVEIEFHPLEFKRAKSTNRRKAVIRETVARYENANTGGSTRKKIMTVYRQEAIEIAFLLKELGAQSPAALKKMGCSSRTGSILYSNFFKWFTRIDKGIYELTSAGRESLQNFSELENKLRAKFQKTLEK